VVSNLNARLLNPVRKRDQISGQIILGILAVFPVRSSPPPAPA